MDPYDAKFRGEVLAACDANKGTKAVALRFHVAETWVRRIKQVRRETEQIAPKTAAPRQPTCMAWSEWLVAKIDAQPDIYLRELQADLKAELGIEVCQMTICKACRGVKKTRKK